MELISNCAHFGSTYTALEVSSNNIPVAVIKASFDKNGAKLLENEIRGLKWYAGRLGIDPESAGSVYNYNDRYVKISIPFRPGSCGNPYLPIQKNYQKMVNAIHYYQTLFGSDEYRYAHGDYSFVNMVFEGDNLRWLIDWEHFSDQLPREFDVLNCIFEMCYYNFMRRKELTSQDVRLISKLLILASNEIGFPEPNLNSPASDFYQLTCSCSAVFGEQINKYALIACPREDIDKMDYYFRKYS